MISTIKQFLTYKKWWHRLKTIISVAYYVLMLAYLICAMIFGIGNLIVNGILLGVTTIIALITVVLSDKKLKKKVKKKKVVKIKTEFD